MNHLAIVFWYSNSIQNHTEPAFDNLKGSPDQIVTNQTRSNKFPNNKCRSVVPRVIPNGNLRIVPRQRNTGSFFKAEFDSFVKDIVMEFKLYSPEQDCDEELNVELCGHFFILEFWNADDFGSDVGGEEVDGFFSSLIIL